ncbi:MAG: DNA starvation/stationary phase protection protein [Saprospiraceae bacterium]
MSVTTVKRKDQIEHISRKADLGITEENLSAISERLFKMLADQHVLYIKTRNYHWNVQGMSFGSLHELLEEQYEEIAVIIDHIAERIRKLAYYVPGSMQDYLKITRLKETGHLDGDAKQMLSNLVDDQEQIIRQLREDIPFCEDDHNDVGTADFLTGVIQQHEEMAWMLRAHLADKKK